MNLNCPFVCEDPGLWGLPAGAPVGLVAMTSVSGRRFTVTSDPAYAVLVLDAVVGLSGEPLVFAAEAFGLFRWGWMVDWADDPADSSAWFPASDGFASESFGASDGY